MQTGAAVRRSRRPVRAIGAAVLTFGLALTACGTDGPGGPGRGGALYRANCAACHGADLGGSSRGPALLDASGDRATVTDAAIADAIRNGVDSGGDLGPMAAIPRLDDEQIDAIVAHIVGLGDTDPPAP